MFGVILTAYRRLVITVRKIWFLATTDKELVYGEINGIRTHLPITQLVRKDEWHFYPDRIEHREFYTKDGVLYKDSTAVFGLPAGMVFNLAQGHLSHG